MCYEISLLLLADSCRQRAVRRVISGVGKLKNTAFSRRQAASPSLDSWSILLKTDQLNKHDEERRTSQDKKSLIKHIKTCLKLRWLNPEYIHIAVAFLFWVKSWRTVAVTGRNRGSNDNDFLSFSRGVFARALMFIMFRVLESPRYPVGTKPARGRRAGRGTETIYIQFCFNHRVRNNFILVSIHPT